MGTTQTEQLQQEIKSLINRLGWSQNKLAIEIYNATFDDDDEHEISKLQSRLKKELNRSTTKTERLSEYIKIITEHHEYEKFCTVTPTYIDRGQLSKNMTEGLKEISQEINMLIDTKNGL